MTEPTRSRRVLILAICCLSLVIVVMDNTIVNIALPSLRAQFHASVSDLQWTVDAYTLVLASLLMLSGSTGDRLGRRRTFQTGLAVFTVGSLLCSIAPGLGWLIAFRMVQAVGGSMLNPIAVSIISNVFTEPRERAQALGVWGSVVGLGMGLGPLVGGTLVDAIGWRSIFWINVPIGLAALLLTAIYVPESRAERARRVDPVGQLLIATTLASLVYSIIEGPRIGWLTPSTLGLFGVALSGGITFVGYESRRTDPLIDPRFFRSMPFCGATVIAVCGFSAFSGFLFLNTLYLQDVRGMSALTAGLCTLPMAVMTFVLPPLSGRIVGSRGARLPLTLAGVCLCVGGLLLIGVSRSTSLGYVLIAYAIFSSGFGMLNPPITNTAVSGMPRSQAGVAAAVASTSRQIGTSLGVAVIGSLVNSRLGPADLGSAFTHAAEPGWILLGALGAVVLILGLVSTSRRARATTSRTAALFVEDVPVRA